VKGKQTSVPSSASQEPIGSNAPWVCPKCKHKNAYWDEYCGNCGESR
jgi:predicted amidophosphoribosyltransferase